MKPDLLGRAVGNFRIFEVNEKSAEYALSRKKKGSKKISSSTSLILVPAIFWQFSFRGLI